MNRQIPLAEATRNLTAASLDLLNSQIGLVTLSPERLKAIQGTINTAVKTLDLFESEVPLKDRMLELIRESGENGISPGHMLSYFHPLDQDEVKSIAFDLWDKGIIRSASDRRWIMEKTEAKTA